MPTKKENKSAETLLQDMAHDSRIRTTEKSKNLMNDYEADLRDLEDKIEAKVDENKKTLIAIRQEQLTRLLTLVRRRSAIETTIAESHTRLIQAYETASSKLRRSAKNHADNIDKAVAAASPDSETQDHGHGSAENKENEAPPAAAIVVNAVKVSKRRSSCTSSGANWQGRMGGVQK